MISGAEYSLECINTNLTVEQLKQKVAKLTGLETKELTIIKINDTLVGEVPLKKTIRFFIDGGESTTNCAISESIEIIYGVLTNFRDVVNGFNSSGLMSDRLLSIVEADSADDLRDNQPPGASIVLLSKENTPDSVLLTLAAIKILRDFFIESQKSWTLVEQKARAAVLAIAGYDATDLDPLLK